MPKKQLKFNFVFDFVHVGKLGYGDSAQGYVEQYHISLFVCL